MFRLKIALLSFLAFCQVVQADGQYEQIKEWGEIAVALKGDYLPFGYHNVEGDLIGLEVDLAKDIAQRLNVRLRKVQATSSNRLDFLQRQRVDLVLATMTDTPERRKLVTALEPRYYSSGVTLLLPKKSPIKRWSQLKKKKVCVLERASFNDGLATQYGFQAIQYESTKAGIIALKDGKCAAWMFEEASILAEISTNLSHDRHFPFHAPLPPILVQPWALAIRNEDNDHQLKKALADVLADWHRSGDLIAMHKRWSMPVTDYLTQMNQTWNKKTAAGAYLCQVTDAGAVTPDECK